jgi:tRNA(Arg) A34 adenosine deaminase TadA
MDAADVAHLRRCIELAREARELGDEPFGSLLVGPDGRVLVEERNAAITLQDVTAHPELMLARWASQHLGPHERAASTMYTSCEHCAMCAAGHHWAGIGRLVFALSGEQLIAMLPSGLPELRLSSREVFARGSYPVKVEGPCAELEAEAKALFEGFWT